MLETYNLTLCMSVLVNLIRRQVSIKAPIFLWCLVSVILDDIKYRRDRELEELTISLVSTPFRRLRSCGLIHGF